MQSRVAWLVGQKIHSKILILRKSKNRQSIKQQSIRQKILRAVIIRPKIRQSGRQISSVNESVVN